MSLQGWRRWAITAALSLVIPSTGRGAPLDARASSCAAASAAYTAYFSGLPEAKISVERPRPFVEALKLSDPLVGWIGRPPAVDLLERLGATGDESALQCPEVMVALREQGDELLTYEQTQRMLKFPPTAASPFLFKIGKPVLGPKGNDALVLIAQERAGLGGGQEILYLQRRAGKWQVVGRKVLGIS